MKISTVQKEGIFQAAKWLKIAALIDADELQSLLEAVPSFAMFPLCGAHPKEAFPMPQERFVSVYRCWIEALKEGRQPTSEELRPWSAVAWVENLETIWLQEAAGCKFFARPCAPYLQVQIHPMCYSSLDGEFRSMIMSQDSIFWGLQFSFPQIYQDPKTQEFLEPSSTLFQMIRRWSRDHTIATPMMVEGVRKNLPVRLGKECFRWINGHPGLIAKNLSVLCLAQN